MTMTVYATRRCSHCGKSGFLSVDEDQLFDWLSGGLIHEAFPGMPAQLREQLLSGMHPECWDAVFAGADND